MSVLIIMYLPSGVVGWCVVVGAGARGGGRGVGADAGGGRG